MKKYSTLILAGLLLLGGCEKIHDYIEDHPSAEMNICMIKSISFTDQYGRADSFTVSYNTVGNPVSVIRPVAGTGFPNYIFKYDVRQRLTDFIGMYTSGNAAEFWHKYFYDGKGRIVIDSVYTLCSLSNGSIANYYWSYRRLYDYDSENRIVRDSFNSVGGPYPSASHFSYDANGNRVGGVYDQKIHFRRTNKIWMFLDRDYSRNNPFNAVSYNGYALPTAVNFSYKTGQLTFLGNTFATAKITYSCK